MGWGRGCGEVAGALSWIYTVYPTYYPSGPGDLIKRLTKHGNSLALILDRPVLDLLEIDAETPLSITTDGTALVVTPVRDPERRQAFLDAMRATNRRYSDAFRRLAE